MTKILTLALLLGILIASSAFADIFKCQQPDGTIVFTDRSSSADCKLERVQNLPLLGVIADTPVSRGSEQSATASSPRSGGQTAKTYDEFNNEVALLVEQFTNARRGAMRGLVGNKLKARRDLTDIRARKITLGGEIEQSTLSSSEKQSLTGMLASITE